jgi:glyoxylase-like metal-dependent hydrolase (beta-lactamase superfamily II)
MIDLYFPDQRVLFTGDYVNLGQLCCNFAFDRKPMPAWIASLETLETLDFDVTVNAHGSSGTKADLAAYRQQVQDLYDAVLAGIDAGQSLDELQASITLDAYRGLANYNQLPAIIQSAYLNLTGAYNR